MASMAIEISTFAMNSMVIFHGYVKLPEGKFDIIDIWRS